MAHEPGNELEALWDRLLSRRPAAVWDAFHSLPPEEQKAVLEHLYRMASEPGWHEEQRLSAEAALAALRRKSDNF
jgi:hypothetical protein